MAQQPVTLSWNGLKVRSKERTILHAQTGAVSGQLLAIMGPSGSGKTTLMNALAYRTQGLDVRGEIQLDGKEWNLKVLQKLGGYVMQQDLLYSHLTVGETLQFAARLRLPREFTKSQRNDRIQSVLELLHITHLYNSRIGSIARPSLSGGEKKRVSVALELLSQPRVLFLDEPTSGLDSGTALVLVTALKALAEQGCTVVCTVHQPQSRIFAQFDSVLVLSGGRSIYFGPVATATDFFAEAGFPCPKKTNPADHLLDVITPTDNPAEARGNERALRHHFKETYDPQVLVGRPSDQSAVSSSYSSSLPSTEDEHELTRVSWFQSFLVLARRALLEYLRGKRRILVQFSQTVVMALMIGFVFFQIGTGQSSIIRRQPVLFFCTINQGMFGALMLLTSFPIEQDIVSRERKAGLYPVSAYFLAKLFVEVALHWIFPVSFSVIVYYLVGLQPGAVHFVTFSALLVLCYLGATSMAFLISIWSRSLTLAVTILPLVLEMMRLFGGFFLSPKNLPDYFVWLDALSYVKYSYIGLSVNELTGLVLTCTDDDLVDGVCPVTSGEQMLEELGMQSYQIGQLFGVLIAYIIIARLIAFVGLLVRK